MIHLYKLLFLSAILGTADLATAQYSETFTGSFAAESEVNIRHRRGPVKVIKSTDGKVSYEATIRFEANNKEEAQKLLDAFAVKSGSNGGRIDIQSSAGIKNMRTINGKSTIQLEDGTKIKGIRKLKISLLVKLPETKRVKVDARYHDVSIDADVSELLAVHTYSANIDVESIKGNLDVNDKYSKGTFGSFGDGRMELYESKFEFGTGQDTEIDAKYATLRFPQLAALNIDSYECKVYIGPVNGKLAINDKYSKFEFGDIQDALIDVYETDLIAGSAQKAQVKSKYADFSFTSIDELYFASSYEDDLKANTVGILRSVSSKYSDYKMEKLTGELEIESYEDDIVIDQPASSIEAIMIKGKYTTLNCPLPASMKFNFELEGKYGSIDLDDDDLDYSIYIDKSSEKRIKGTRNNASESDAKLAFNCYECKLRLKN